MLKYFKVVPALCLGLVVMLASTSASAQSMNDNNGEGAGLALLTTTTGITTTVAGGVALTVLLLDSGDSASKETYIRQNALALQQDITVGSGESIEDLAAAFRVSEEHLPAFASAIRSHREQLVPLTHVEKLDAKRAEQFFAIVARAMREKPALRRELEEISTSG